MKLRILGLVANRKFCSLSVGVLFLCLVFAGCEKTVKATAPDAQMGAILFSRSSIRDVKTFREKNYIHGLGFFYLRLSDKDIGRVVTWLEMKEQNSVPSLLSDRVLAAAAGTDWPFNWNAQKIYATFYCHPFDGTYWSVDMLLVNNREAVFVTEGYLPPGSYVTDDPSLCETPKN